MIPPCLHSLLAGPWMIFPEAAEAFAQTVESMVPQLNGLMPEGDEDEMAEELVTDLGFPVDEEGRARIGLHGVIAYDVGWIARYLGIADLKVFNEQITAALEADHVKSITVDVASPGGGAIYLYETMQAVTEARREKPIHFETRKLAASAAYFIASQGTSFRATASALVGSIGAYAVHLDFGKARERAGIKVDVIRNKEGEYKAAGILGSSLTAKQRQQKLEYVQNSYDEPAKLMRAARPQLKEEFMNGALYSASQAYWQGMGMVDDLLAR